MPYPPLFCFTALININSTGVFKNNSSSLATCKLRPPHACLCLTLHKHNRKLATWAVMHSVVTTTTKYLKIKVCGELLFSTVITVQLLVSMVGGLEGVWVPWCFHNQVKTLLPFSPLQTRYCQVQVFKQHGAASQCSSTFL